jgi:gamma-glutamyltranspeptidase/glutathione hydrolase
MEAGLREQLMAGARQGRKPAVSTSSSLIVSSHPIATHAGAEVLREGGTACDAVLAAAITQTVVEPQMTSIAGMMKLVYHDAAERQTWWMSSGHRAPRAPLGRLDGESVLSGLGVAVPGWWAGFEAARERFGTRTRRALMASAIELAREGVEVYPQLYGVMYKEEEQLGATPEGREVFFADGERLLVPGELLRQRAAAETLERLAEEGSEHFYRGEFARGLCELVQARGGVLDIEDLAAYEPVWSEAVRGSYRGYEIATSGVPDGGLNIIEALNMVEQLDLERLGPPSESEELCYELMLIAQDVLESGAGQRDPHAAPDATATLTSKSYAAERLALLHMAGPRLGFEAPNVGTDHLTAVDRHGNVAVMMHTCTADPWINGFFHAGISIPAAAGWTTRTPVPPGGRITIDGAENIAFRDGLPVLASGSPSGSLLTCVLQNMVNILDFGMDIEESVLRPRFGFTGVGSGRLAVEAGMPETVLDGLRRRGMPFKQIGPYDAYMGSYEAISLQDGRLAACPDPRRTGSAAGD